MKKPNIGRDDELFDVWRRLFANPYGLSVAQLLDATIGSQVDVVDLLTFLDGNGFPGILKQAANQFLFENVGLLLPGSFDVSCLVRSKESALHELGGDGGQDLSENELRALVVIESLAQLKAVLESFLDIDKEPSPGVDTVAFLPDKAVPKCMFTALGALVELSLGHISVAVRIGQLAICENAVFGFASAPIDDDDPRMVGTAVSVMEILAVITIETAVKIKYEVPRT